MTVVYNPEGLPAEWPDVAAVVQVNREREVGGERTVTSHYYISSHEGLVACQRRTDGNASHSGIDQT